MAISASTFIRDTFTGAFCLFESMASLLPFVDELVVLDMGSTDGTLEVLKEIAEHNKKLCVLQRQFSHLDAAAFADAANECVAACRHDTVLFYQADEIWHEKLLLLMAEWLEQGEADLSFWRIQYRDNWQKVKWFPHPVHRIGCKGSFNFVTDGMSTDRTWGAKLCSTYDMGYFLKWGEMGQEGIKPYVHEMIMDVSLVGGFRDNIVERRALHAPFWHEEPTIEGLPANKWTAHALANPDWTKTETPYNIPAIMRYHIGRTRYTLRTELLEALKTDSTRGLLGL